MKKNPLVSICIPTHNRQQYLDQCLQKITIQFRDKNILSNVEIIILDNNSVDETNEIAGKYVKQYGNIYFYKNKKNIGLWKNVIKVGKYARGEYIWFCSDDDLHNSGSISEIFAKINEFHPDIIYCNLDEYSKDMKTLIHKNSLDIDKDSFLPDRKNFFKFLNSKFPYSIDWYTTFYSDLIVKKDIYLNTSNLSRKYDSPFPHSLGIYYTNINYSVYVISKSLIKYRGSNYSYSSNNKKNDLIDWDRMLTEHYRNIYEINKEFVPKSFKYKILIKNLIRKFKYLYVEITTLANK